MSACCELLLSGYILRKKAVLMASLSLLRGTECENSDI